MDKGKRRGNKKRRLGIRFIKGLAEGFLSGSFKSGKVGSWGAEIAEKRMFVPGRDRISSIDWKTILKARPEAFCYEKERNIAMMLVADVSRSMAFSSTDVRKSDIVALFFEIASGFAFQGNSVGALAFDSEVRKIQMPYGAAAIQDMADEVLDYSRSFDGRSSTRTNLQPALVELLASLTECSLIMIVSDFNFSVNYSSELLRLYGSHDVVPVVVTDPCDNISARKRSYFVFRDMETGQVLSVSGLKANREHINVFKNLGIGYLEVGTDDSESKIFAKINKFFGRRRL